jgi:hypothetical protein
VTVRSDSLTTMGKSPQPQNQYTLLMKFDFDLSRFHMRPCAS